MHSGLLGQRERLLGLCGDFPDVCATQQCAVYTDRKTDGGKAGIAVGSRQSADRLYADTASV